MLPGLGENIALAIFFVAPHGIAVALFTFVAVLTADHISSRLAKIWRILPEYAHFGAGTAYFIMIFKVKA